MYSRYRDPHCKSAENDHSPLFLLLSLKRKLKQTRMIAIWKQKREDDKQLRMVVTEALRNVIVKQYTSEVQAIFSVY